MNNLNAIPARQERLRQRKTAHHSHGTRPIETPLVEGHFCRSLPQSGWGPAIRLADIAQFRRLLRLLAKAPLVLEPHRAARYKGKRDRKEGEGREGAKCMNEHGKLRRF